MTTTAAAMPRNPTLSVAVTNHLPETMISAMPNVGSSPASPCADQLARELRRSAVGASSCSDQDSRDAQTLHVAATPSETMLSAMPSDQALSVAVTNHLPETMRSTMPRHGPSPASPCADQLAHELRRSPVGASSCSDQQSADAHVVRVAATPSETNGRSIPELVTSPIQLNSSLATVELKFCAEWLNDVESLRMATEARLGAFVREGFSPDQYGAQLHQLTALEHAAVLSLQRARLVAAIENVSYNKAAGRPRRGPAELWAYCGFVPGQRRQKGVRSNWNADAKMRAFLVAESCLRAGVRKLDGCDDSDGYDWINRQSITPYGAKYLDARENWAARDTTEAHKHQHALRCVAKAVLKDLFLEARKVGA